MPYPNSVFEVTTRTIQGRILLLPSEQLNDIILGILVRALTLYPILLHLVVVASNHCVRALVEGHTLHGTWYDRSAEYEARRQGKEF